MVLMVMNLLFGTGMKYDPAKIIFTSISNKTYMHEVPWYGEPLKVFEVKEPAPGNVLTTAHEVQDTNEVYNVSKQSKLVRIPYRLNLEGEDDHLSFNGRGGGQYLGANRASHGLLFLLSYEGITLPNGDHYIHDTGGEIGWNALRHDLPELALRVSKSELPSYVFRVLAYDQKGIVEPDARVLLSEAKRRGEKTDLTSIAARHQTYGVAIAERVTDRRTLEEVISRLEDALKKEYEDAEWGEPLFSNVDLN